LDQPPSESAISRLFACEHAVNLWHDGSTFTHRRCDTLSRTRPHIPDGEDAGATGLKRQDRPLNIAFFRSGIRSRHHETLIVQRDAMI